MSHQAFKILPYFLASAAALALGAVIGCSTPQERYKTLSIFFDGVPNPATHVTNTSGITTASTEPAPHIVSQHRPYLDNKCDACHRSTTGDIMQFADAYNACVKCHTNVTNERHLMHGPVATAACKYCHAPHESVEPVLLKESPVKVCTQCHDQQLLSNFPIQHTDGTTSCLQCHFGHGGDRRYFLKSAPPDTAPADLPPAIHTSELTQATSDSQELSAGVAGTLPTEPAAQEEDPP